MPDNFQFTGWQQLLQAFTAKVLTDPTIPSKFLETKASHDFPFTVGPLTFSIQPEARASATFFNSADDVENDPMDGVIGLEHKDGSLPPQIQFSDKGVWIAYQVTAGVKGEGGTNIGALGLTIEGEKVVQLCDYHFHADGSEKLRDAIAADLNSARFALRRSDLSKLQPNEAVCYRLRARLATTIEASWSDALTANLNGLNAFLRINTPIAIKFNAGAQIKLGIALTDDFLLVFSRETEERIRLGVRKGRVSTQALSGSTGIEVGLANPEQLASAVTSVLEGIAGASVDKVDSLLQETVVSNLTSDQKSLFTQLLSRLKLDDEMASLLSVRTHWERLKTEAQDRLASLLTEKVSAAFRYEYSRIRSESTLLQVALPEKALVSDDSGQLHSSLLKANLSETLDWCRKNRVVPEKYLHERRLSIQQNWGLSISLGRFLTIGGKDIEKLDSVTREDFQGRRQITFLGQRGYEGTWVGQKQTWMADFDAGMPGFAQEPRLSSFQFGLRFKWLWEEKKLSNDEILECIDHAEIWRATNDRAAALKELEPCVGKKVRISLDVTIDDFAFRHLLKAAANTSRDQFAIAMAKAMPRDSFAARAIVERRTRLYAPLWKKYLEEPERSYRDYARMARATLQQLENGAEVAFIEGEISSSDSRTAWPVSFAEMIRLNGTQISDLSGIADDWNSFRNAITSLHQDISADAMPDQLKPVFKGFSRLWSQSLQLRAVGVFWIDLAAAHELLGHVERSLTVNLVDDGLQIHLAVPSR